MVEYSAYVGLDVHNDTISVAVAFPGREDPVFRGEIRNQRSSLRRLIGRLSPDGEVISFCYEAGPCGYGVYREIVATGHHCEVVAPSLIPRRAGDRVKTGRRDALNLAGLYRAGTLTSVFLRAPGRTHRNRAQINGAIPCRWRFHGRHPATSKTKWSAPESAYVAPPTR